MHTAYLQRLLEAVPSQWCMSDLVEEVNVSGTAFTDGLNQKEVHCKYKLENGEEHSNVCVYILLSSATFQ